MALDRLFTMYPSLAALNAGAAGVGVWGERTVRSALVGTGDIQAYSVDRLLEKESATLRIRWRSDITLRSVLVAPDGDVWLIERIGEVGRRQYLDVAASTFQGVTADDQLIGWPRTTDPWTSPTYGDGVAKYTLADGAGAIVQNLTIRGWSEVNEVALTPSLAFDANDRVGYWTAGVRFVNGGYAGRVPYVETPVNWRAQQSSMVQVQSRNGRIGYLYSSVNDGANARSFTVQSDDAWITIGTTLVLGYCVVRFDGSRDPGLAIGQAIRVRSQEEIDAD